MGRIKQINIKNRTYYFFDDKHNIQYFDSDLIKIDKKSYKNTDIYYIGYITVKYFDYDDVHTVNLLHFIIHAVYGYTEEKNRNK